MVRIQSTRTRWVTGSQKARVGRQRLTVSLTSALLGMRCRGYEGKAQMAGRQLVKWAAGVGVNITKQHKSTFAPKKSWLEMQKCRGGIHRGT